MASPVGPLLLEVEGGALVAVRTAPPPSGCTPGGLAEVPGPAAAVLSEAERQLEQYFAGLRETFDLPLQATGTPFQRAVWSTLAQIPFGQTWTYRQVAAHLGRPTATRAVGAACGRNPLPVVVPCHRVIGADGSLTGFAGGVAVKAALLALEARTLGAVPA